MTKRVLTMSARSDLHADLVARKMESLGRPMFRLNFDEFPEHFDIEIELAGGAWEGWITYVPTGDRIALHEIGAVWMRKKAGFSFASKQLGPQEQAHASAETRHLLLSLLYSLDCYWMSHPLALRNASWKGEQLQRAARIGFSVPRSIATNSVDHARTFLADQGEVVFKPLSSPTLAAEEVTPEDRVANGLRTTRITADHSGDMEAVAEAPCFFQRYIAKRHELRVTVIGERVFAARIHSQDDPRTATDWRDMSAEILFEKAELPGAIENRCRAFVHSYGLSFGALDLIVTPEEDYVFLENNPVGQFLFVQELIPEFDLIGAVTDCLLDGAGQMAMRS